MATKNTRPPQRPQNPESNNAPFKSNFGSGDAAQQFLKPEKLSKSSNNSFTDAENDFAINRIINSQGAAEGTTLPPRQGGELRVPLVTGLKVARVSRYFGQTQVTLVWDQPEIVQTQISHFNVYVTGLLPDGRQPQGPTSVAKSPGQVLVTTKVPVVAVFTVQTVLKSGLMSLIGTSPSVSAPIAGGNFTPSDYPPGTIPVDALEDAPPGSLISWDNTGTVGLVGPGATNLILTGNGAAFPSWRSRATLNLVQGYSNLITPGAITFVSPTPGIITEDPTELFYDTATKYIGIGTDTPASKLSVIQPVLSSGVQHLETAGVTELTVQNQVLTTDATPVVLNTILIPSATTLAVEITAVARRTSGAAGTAEDGARYKIWAVYKNVAGTATLIGTVSKLEDEDQPAWDCYLVPSSNTVLLAVMGAVDNNITWNVTLRLYNA